MTPSVTITSLVRFKDFFSGVSTSEIVIARDVGVVAGRFKAFLSRVSMSDIVIARGTGVVGPPLRMPGVTAGPAGTWNLGRQEGMWEEEEGGLGQKSGVSGDGLKGGGVKGGRRRGEEERGERREGKEGKEGGGG